MRILMLSAYDADSHRYWRQGLIKHLDEFHWTQLTLPPRFFSWRIRGNPLSWYFEQHEILNRHYDLIIATSMVDLATLKGIIPNLSSIPTLVYFHENQFDYPPNAGKHSNLEGQMVNLYTALAADRIVFNSEYNKNSFFHGIKALIKKLPDHAPIQVIDCLKRKTDVLPVPVDDAVFETHSSRVPQQDCILVWNHRWEYDKSPQRLYLVLRLLKSKNGAFKINILGQQFQNSPDVFEKMEMEFPSHLAHFGYIENRWEYYRILRQSDVAISTAIHEFQGIAILEAVASGCIPLAPNRLSYPEIFPERFLYPSYPDDENREAEILAERLLSLIEQHKHSKLPNPPDIENFSWRQLKDGYRNLIKETANRRLG